MKEVVEEEVVEDELMEEAVEGEGCTETPPTRSLALQALVRTL